MFSHPTAHMMRRRYNSAPGFLQQKQYDINIHNYNVGVFNQYLGGPASAPSPSPQMSAVAMCNHGNLPEQTPAPFARAGLNTTQLSTNVQLNQVPTRHQPTITDLSSTRSVLDDHSGQDQSQLKYSTTSTDEMTNYQIANNGVGHTDWNSTHTSSSSFIPIPSPLPWSMCADSHQALPNSTTSENTVPNCQWLPISEGSTSGFNPAIFSTPASHSNWSTTIPRPLNSTATHQVPQHDKTHCNDPQTKPRSCHSMYPSADELSQHYLTLLQQVFPEHNSTALQHVLGRLQKAQTTLWLPCVLSNSSCITVY